VNYVTTTRFSSPNESLQGDKPNKDDSLDLIINSSIRRKNRALFQFCSTLGIDYGFIIVLFSVE
jgi:hypothetical protein